uniref:Uncharacterized protein n=1 Tax=Parastrongyloides trichosuri TaxID=131310 RepID=A0A0N5A0J2_PARTI
MTEQYVKTEYTFRDDESLSSISSNEDFCEQDYNIRKIVRCVLTPHTYVFWGKQPWIKNFTLSFNNKKRFSSTITFVEVGSQTTELPPTMYDASSQTDDIVLEHKLLQVEYPIEFIPINITKEETFLRLLKLLSFLNNKDSWLIWYSQKANKSIQFHISAFSKNSTKILAVTRNIKYVRFI